MPTMSADGAASWMEFDPCWYREAYGRVIGTKLERDEDALDFYLEEGQKLGHCPNPFFDEAWYLRIYPDVREAVENGDYQSGFDHYRRNPDGVRQPHWLFDPEFYGEQYPELTREFLSAEGFVDSYDHFLRLGDIGGCTPSHFFSPGFYRSELDIYEAKNTETEGSFRHYLRRFRISIPELQLSPYFDPVWYLRRYPAVAAEVSRGLWRSALDHFLSNATPQAFDPLSIFSEAYYLQRNEDVARAVDAGSLRSGYQHFIRHGIAELRHFSPRIDLAHYLNAHSSVQVDLERGRAPNVFVHLLTVGATHGLAAHPTETKASLPSELEGRTLFRLEAAGLALLAARQPIDFSYTGAPALSVIVVLHNQFALTVAALSSLRSNFSGPLQVILADSGSSDHTIHIERFVRGARIVRFKQNVNFVLACNAALAEAEADAILYLNNDTLLAPGAIAQALRRLHSADDIGAVGGKVVRSHGLLQEAGNIIWRDGNTSGYMRDGSPLAPEVNFVRDVDFCSGVFLMVRADLARRLGGFDIDYAPAYFEETDLCVRIHQAGYRVVYDPGVCLQHLEYGSSASSQAAMAQIERSHAVFLKKHEGWLAGQPAREADGDLNARSRPNDAKRILFIEDNLPLRFTGSGFVRSNDIVASMAEMGLEVTVFPIMRPDFEIAAIYADFPDTVEVMHDRTFDDIEDFLASRPNYYDIIWIGRTHNLDRLKNVLVKLRADERHRIVLDTESVFSVRLQQKAALADTSLPFDFDEALSAEFKNAGLCDAVLATSDQEMNVLRKAGLRSVSVLGHMRDLRLTPRPFHERSGLLFVGAMHGEDSPNYDSLCWFVDNVLDLVEEQLGPATHLTIIGHVAEDASLVRFADDPRLTVLGSVADLEPHYDRHRVFIAPTRIAAGLPYKVHEAASFGVPIVASQLLQQQTGWRHGEEMLAADVAEPNKFAEKIVELYRSPELWQHLRQCAANRLETENSRTGYGKALAAALFPSAEKP